MDLPIYLEPDGEMTLGRSGNQSELIRDKESLNRFIDYYKPSNINVSEYFDHNDMKDIISCLNGRKLEKLKIRTDQCVDIDLFKNIDVTILKIRSYLLKIPINVNCELNISKLIMTVKLDKFLLSNLSKYISKSQISKLKLIITKNSTNIRTYDMIDFAKSNLNELYIVFEYDYDTKEYPPYNAKCIYDREFFDMMIENTTIETFSFIDINLKDSKSYIDNKLFAELFSKTKHIKNIGYYKYTYDIAIAIASNPVIKKLETYDDDPPDYCSFKYLMQYSKLEILHENWKYDGYKIPINKLMFEVFETNVYLTSCETLLHLRKIMNNLQWSSNYNSNIKPYYLYLCLDILERNKSFYMKNIHKDILDITITLASSLQLYPYLILEIYDWTIPDPSYSHIIHRQKIQYIQQIVGSIRSLK